MRTIGVHKLNLKVRSSIGSEGNMLAIRGPRGFSIGKLIVAQVPLMRAVPIHEINLNALRVIGQRFSIAQ